MCLVRLECVNYKIIAHPLHTTFFPNIVKHTPLPSNKHPNMKVAIIGATGQTGTSIVNGLLASTETQFVSYHQILSKIPTLTPGTGHHRPCQTVITQEAKCDGTAGQGCKHNVFQH